MKIRLTKNTKDPRLGKSKILPKGREIVVDANSPFVALLDEGAAERVAVGEGGIIITKSDQVEDALGKIEEKE
uniref:hypothetical protein n=1 Tax=Lewinella sp. TaxID=2004506 RepID=UPI003D6B5E97